MYIQYHPFPTSGRYREAQSPPRVTGWTSRVLFEREFHFFFNHLIKNSDFHLVYYKAWCDFFTAILLYLYINKFNFFYYKRMVRGTFSVNLLNAKILTYCNLQMAQVAWLGISYSGKKRHYAHDKWAQLPGMSLGLISFNKWLCSAFSCIHIEKVLLG